MLYFVPPSPSHLFLPPQPYWSPSSFYLFTSSCISLLPSCPRGLLPSPLSSLMHHFFGPRPVLRRTLPLLLFIATSGLVVVRVRLCTVASIYISRSRTWERILESLAPGACQERAEMGVGGSPCSSWRISIPGIDTAEHKLIRLSSSSIDIGA